MPWDGYHLHRFYNKDISVKSPDIFEDTDDRCCHYEDIIIGDFLETEGDKCKYEYDFGDSWKHTITVEKVVPPLTDSRAKFITGKNMSPSEDCGGIWGYEYLIKVMQNPKSSEYKKMREWLTLDDDEIFDPKDMGFLDEDINFINEGFKGMF